MKFEISVYIILRSRMLVQECQRQPGWRGGIQSSHLRPSTHNERICVAIAAFLSPSVCHPLFTYYTYISTVALPHAAPFAPAKNYSRNFQWKIPNLFGRRGRSDCNSGSKRAFAGCRVVQTTLGVIAISLPIYLTYLSAYLPVCLSRFYKIARTIANIVRICSRLLLVMSSQYYIVRIVFVVCCRITRVLSSEQSCVCSQVLLFRRLFYLPTYICTVRNCDL